MYKSILLFLLLLNFHTRAQICDFKKGELLVQFYTDKSLNYYKNLSQDYFFEPVSEDWNIYLLKFDSTKFDTKSVLTTFQNNPNVTKVQYNHVVSYRSVIPNDPRFSQWQWNLDLLGLTDAWDFTKGGITAVGDSIVVAVIDGGCDIFHEDLSQNIYVNHNEIPEDNIDNDQNGYVDDYFGWQVVNGNDQHLPNSHGTSVSGIIGAVGDNAIGMTGMNWNVKLMIISADEQNLLLESNIIKAYRYVLDQKRLYRETNGQKGAFVVAVNLSAGVDFGKAADFPIWCSIYDSLGQEGILSSGAVMNDGINIDEKGDIPSVCSSPFHITVTNTTRYDALDLNSAFGSKHLDLGAPGAVYATRPNNTYNVFGGTSGAAPQVSAAVALLAAYPDSAWAKKLKDFPETTALEMKSLILNGVDKVTALQGISQSGGRLNVSNAMSLLSKLHTKPFIPIDIDFWQGEELLVRFNVPQAGVYYFDIFDILGRLRYRRQITTNMEGLCQTFLEIPSGLKEILFLRLSDSTGTLLNTLKFNK